MKSLGVRSIVRHVLVLSHPRVLQPSGARCGALGVWRHSPRGLPDAGALHQASLTAVDAFEQRRNVTRQIRGRVSTSSPSAGLFYGRPTCRDSTDSYVGDCELNLRIFGGICAPGRSRPGPGDLIKFIR